MARANYCEFFRFDDQYCDVFIEDGHYLYAEADPFQWFHFLTVNEWHATRNLHGETEWIRHDAAGADTAYLETLEPAPVDVAQFIIKREYARSLYYSTRGDSCAWYGFDDPPTMAECMEDAEAYAGELCNC